MPTISNASAWPGFCRPLSLEVQGPYRRIGKLPEDKGEMDLRVGGPVELRLDVQEAPDRARAGALIRGLVSACEPPRVLACSWIDASADRPPAESPVPDSIVTFELEARGDNVLLVLTGAQPE